MSDGRWSRRVSNICSGYIGTPASIKQQAVSTAMNTPVRPTPALSEKLCKNYKQMHSEASLLVQKSEANPPGTDIK